MPHPKFLGTTAAIRRELLDRVAGLDHLDMAVAFVTSEWQDVLREFRGKGRLVCWLTSGATDPYAIEQLRRSKTTRVRVKHLNGMHAKVYVSSKTGFAIVGSANLSTPALAGEDHAGNVEAAVLLETPAAVAMAQTWFDELWEEAEKITANDMAKARRAYDLNRKRRAERAKAAPSSGQGHIWSLPEEKKIWKRLRELANQVRARDLREEVGRPTRFDPASMSRGHLQKVRDRLVLLAGHPASFDPVMNEPLAKVRRSFSTAFNEALPIEGRFDMLKQKEKLAGVGLTSWTVILQYRDPDRYPPYNGPTIQFIENCLRQHAPGISPRTYSAWVAFCGELASQLRLSSAGHIDRMVWRYAEEQAEV